MTRGGTSRPGKRPSGGAVAVARPRRGARGGRGQNRGPLAGCQRSGGGLSTRVRRGAAPSNTARGTPGVRLPAVTEARVTQTHPSHEAVGAASTRRSARPHHRAPGLPGSRKDGAGDGPRRHAGTRRQVSTRPRRKQQGGFGASAMRPGRRVKRARIEAAGLSRPPWPAPPSPASRGKARETAP
jgi:hypothetical protein